MVGETGFEPATPWTQTKCATKLRYSPIFHKLFQHLLICLRVHVMCIPLHTKDLECFKWFY